MPDPDASDMGLTGVIESRGTIQSSTDSAIDTDGSAEFTGFAKTNGLNLQYANFGQWILRPCGADDECAPGYVVMVAGGNPGVVPTSSMPTTGSASYSGLATGVIEQANEAATFKGNVGLTADFASGAVTGQIAAIQAYDTDTEQQIGTINSIGLAATISGAAYTGTTTVVGKPGTAFDISGAQGQVTGGFYGPGAAETAGVFYLDGGANDTHLSGAFGAKAGADLLTQFREVATIGTDDDGVTVALNTDLSGSGGIIITTDNASAAGFSAIAPFVTKTSPSPTVVVAVAGNANVPTSENLVGKTATELALAITSSTDPAITTSHGGFIDNFADAEGLSYTSFGTWTLNPCANSGDCLAAYAGTFGGSASGGYQTAAMPTSGSASYSGGATGFVQQPGAINELNAARFYGSASLTADFAGGTVTGGVTGINAYELDANTLLGTINNVSISATIAGSGFSGTTAASGSAGTAFDITGATGTVNGGFYGPNADEVAGVFNLTGGADSTTLLGSFGAQK